MAEVLADGLKPDERRRFDADALAGPLGSRLDIVTKRGAARRREFVTLLKPYVTGVDARVKRDLPVARRIAFHLIEHREIDDLADGEALQKLVAAAAEPSRRVRKKLRWYADLPLQDELPEALFRLRAADLIPMTQIEDVSWSGGRLHVSGHAYLAGLSVRSRRFNRATVVLRGPRWLPPVRLRTRRVFHPEATHGAEEAGCNYDWSGFTAELLVVAALAFRGAGRRTRRQAAAAPPRHGAGHHHLARRDRDLEQGRPRRRPAARPLHRPYRAPIGARPRWGLVDPPRLDLRPGTPGGAAAHQGRTDRREAGRRAAGGPGLPAGQGGEQGPRPAGRSPDRRGLHTRRRRHRGRRAARRGLPAGGTRRRPSLDRAQGRPGGLRHDRQGGGEPYGRRGP